MPIQEPGPFSHQALLEVADSGPGAPEFPGEGSWGGQSAAEAAKQALERAILGQGSFKLVLAVVNLGSVLFVQQDLSRCGARVGDGLDQTDVLTEYWSPGPAASASDWE